MLNYKGVFLVGEALALQTQHKIKVAALLALLPQLNSDHDG